MHTLQAKDLRLGNLVSLYLGRPEDDGYYQVTGLLENKVLFKVPWDGKPFQADLDIVFGIPLSHEWLERMGWDKLSYSESYTLKIDGEFMLRWYIKYNYMVLIAEPEEDPYVKAEKHLPHIKYIHDLQNLIYALTQSELQVKEHDSTGAKS